MQKDSKKNTRETREKLPELPAPFYPLGETSNHHKSRPCKPEDTRWTQAKRTRLRWGAGLESPGDIAPTTYIGGAAGATPPRAKLAVKLQGLIAEEAGKRLAMTQLKGEILMGRQRHRF